MSIAGFSMVCAAAGKIPASREMRTNVRMDGPPLDETDLGRWRFARVCSRRWSSVQRHPAEDGIFATCVNIERARLIVRLERKLPESTRGPRARGERRLRGMAKQQGRGSEQRNQHPMHDQ